MNRARVTTFLAVAFAASPALAIPFGSQPVRPDPIENATAGTTCQDSPKLVYGGGALKPRELQAELATEHGMQHRRGGKSRVGATRPRGAMTRRPIDCSANIDTSAAPARLSTSKRNLEKARIRSGYLAAIPANNARNSPALMAVMMSAGSQIPSITEGRIFAEAMAPPLAKTWGTLSIT